MHVGPGSETVLRRMTGPQSRTSVSRCTTRGLLPWRFTISSRGSFAIGAIWCCVRQIWRLSTRHPGCALDVLTLATISSYLPRHPLSLLQLELCPKFNLLLPLPHTLRRS